MVTRPTAQNMPLMLGELTVDLARRLATGPSGEISLTAKETALLQYLWERAPDPVAREAILVDVWGYAPTVQTRAIHHAVTRLRKKLEPDPSAPQFLLNVYGHGYRLEPTRPLDAAALVPGAPATRAVDRLIGREEVLDTLRAHAAAPLVTLVGPAGIGKSAVATTLLSERASPWHVDLSDCATRCQVDAALVTAFAKTRSGSTSDPVTALQALGPTTVLLDGCEQLLPTLREVVKHWMQAAPSVRFIATSQAPLELRSEIVVHLDGLDVPLQSATEAELLESPAVQLFLAHARRPGLNLSEIAEVVRCVDGIPMAIELAAAHTALLSPHQILQRLDRRFTLLRRTSRTGNPRRDTLWDALSWTWEHLDPLAQATLVQLRVFRGPFTVEDAEAVVVLGPDDSLLQALQALVQISLLRTRTDDRRVLLSLTRTVRAFAEARGTATDDAQGRHARHFAAVQEGDLSDLVAAAEHALASGCSDTAHRAGLAALRDYASKGPILEGLDLAGRLFAHPSQPQPTGPFFLRRGWLRHLAGLSQAAEQDLRAAIDSATETNNLALESESRTCLGALLLKTRGTEAARSELETALHSARTIGDPRCIGPAARELAVLHKQAGALDVALEHYEAARAAFHALGDRANVARVLGYIGNIHLHAGRSESASQCLRSALRVHHEVGALQSEALCQSNLAVLHLRQGQHDQAEQRLEAALALAQRIGDVRVQSVALTNLGAVQNERGDVVAARETFRQARHLQRKAQLARHLATATSYLANLEARSNAHTVAEELYAEALALSEDLGDRSGIALTLRNRALNRLITGYATGASEDLSHALEHAESTGEPTSLGLIHLMQAWCHALTGERDRAEDTAAIGWAELATSSEPIGTALGEIIRGVVSLHLGRPEDAAASIDAARSTCEQFKLGEHTVVPWVCRYLTQLLVAAPRA